MANIIDDRTTSMITSEKLQEWMVATLQVVTLKEWTAAGVVAPINIPTAATNNTTKVEKTSRAMNYRPNAQHNRKSKYQ